MTITREPLFIIIVRRYNARTYAEIFRLPAFDAQASAILQLKNEENVPAFSASTRHVPYFSRLRRVIFYASLSLRSP